jgi:hypothetical protein
LLSFSSNNASPVQTRKSKYLWRVEVMHVRKEIRAAGLRIKPKNDFLRLDKPFNDAVRSRKTSAVGQVLLRVPLTGDNARRTAKKVLADRRVRR